MKQLLLILLLIIGCSGFAQTGIGTTTPEASAQLDVSSTTKGFLAPRMTAVQRTSISSPATGLMVYQTDGTAGYYYNNGSSWIQIGLASDATQWTTTGSNLYYNDGNVGIGTTSPTDAMLDISRVVGSSCALKLEGDDTSVGLPNINFVNNNGGGTGTLTWTGTNFGFTGGNVGIGTTSPSTQLELGINTSGTPTYNFFSAGNIGGDNTPKVQFSIESSRANMFEIFGKTGESSLSSMMSIDLSNGNVGIGTTSLTEKLHLEGNMKLNGEIDFDVSDASNTSYGEIEFGTTPDPSGSLTSYVTNYGGDDYGIVIHAGYALDDGGIKVTDDGIVIWGAGDEDLFRIVNEDKNTLEFIINDLGYVGIGVSPSYPLDMSGGAYCTGTTWTNASDRRLKRDIQPMTNYGLKEVMKLQPVAYYYKSDKTNHKQVGFIAQDVQKIIPEVVSGKEGELEKGETLGISYGNIVPVLTKAIQEQQYEIETLKAENAALKQKVDALNQLKTEVENLKKMIITDGTQLSKN